MHETDAGGDRNRLTSGRDDGTQALDDTLRNSVEPLVPGFEQHAEVVLAVQPAHAVACTHRTAQPVGDLEQQLVSRVVSQCLLDTVEVVDVHDENAPGQAVTLRAPPRVLDMVLEG